jgi:hypothetical protein
MFKRHFFLKYALQSSVSDPDPHWTRIRLAFWIRIRIRNADPYPKGVKSAEIAGENEAKRKIIHHKKLILCIKAYLRQSVRLNCLNLTLFDDENRTKFHFEKKFAHF